MTNHEAEELFKKIFGTDPDKVIKRLRSNFRYIKEMDKEAVCEAARSLRVEAAAAGLSSHPAVLELLEAMRVRMMALSNKKAFNSALGQDIRRKIWYATPLQLTFMLLAKIFLYGLLTAFAVLGVIIIGSSIILSFMILAS